MIEKEFFHGEPIEKMIRITGEISDLHQNGKSVLVLTFDKNRKLVYKPRSLEIDCPVGTIYERICFSK